MEDMEYFGGLTHYLYANILPMRLLVFLMIPLFLMSCNNEPKGFGKGALGLDSLDFSLNVVRFYDDPMLYNPAGDVLIKKDTLTESMGWDDERPAGIVYNQVSFINSKIVARYRGLSCFGMHMATTLDNKLMAVNAIVAEISKADNDKFIGAMNERYGVAEKRSDQFIRTEYDIYRWQLEDRIIQYSPIYTDEENVLKLKLSEEGIQEGEAKPHYRGYLYIVKNEYKDSVMGKIHSGDFLYCD